MSISIARRIAATLKITSETQIRRLNQALLEYVRLTRQSPIVSGGGGSGGGGAATWVLKDADFTLAAGDRINATAIATAIDGALPATIAEGDEFVVHNATTSTKVVQIDPDSHSIKGRFGTVTSFDTLVLALGDTVHLVAVSSSVLEIV